MVVLSLLVVPLALRSAGEADATFSSRVRGAAKRERLAVKVSILANRRAIALRDMVLVKTAADRESSKSTAVKAHEDLQASLSSLKEAVAAAADATEPDRPLVRTIDKVESAYSPVALTIVGLAETGKRTEAVKKMDVECKPLLAALIGAATEYVDHSREQATRSVEASAANYAAQRAWPIAMGALSAAGAVALGSLFIRRLVKSPDGELAELSDAARPVAQGGLRPVRGVHGRRRAGVHAHSAIAPRRYAPASSACDKSGPVGQP